jgi:tetratricopeptide (TPR) repeat protein
MRQTLIILFLLMALSIVAVPQDACCQVVTANDGTARKISVVDSIRLRRYLDTINTLSIFSQKYQTYFDSALAIKPWNAYWWQQKAMPLFKRQKYEAGLPYLDSAVKYDQHRYIDYRAFMKCVFQKNYTGAIRDFQTSKAVIGAGAVMDHSYDFYIGLCYLQLNMLDSAEYFLNKTIDAQRLSVGSKWVHPLDLFYLGVVCYEQASYARAIVVFDSCLALYPNFSDAKYYKAICLSRTGLKEQGKLLMTEAGNDFNQGYTINEDNAIYEWYPYQVRKGYFR